MDRIAKASAFDRTSLFLEAQNRRPLISAAIVEKDFWVCWTLRRLFEVLQFRPLLIFKGGTSLSKAYGAIERFSEDVDLSLSRRDLGFADDRDLEQAGISKKEARRRLGELVTECQTVVRDKLVPAIRNDFASVLGGRGWSAELDSEDPQTVIFSYPTSSVSGAVSYVRPAIRLELGARSDDWPAVEANIAPYAAETLPDLFAIRSCQVRTLVAERTFWEKATLLHAECHRPEDRPSPDRLSRHYYDLLQLTRKGIADRAVEKLDLLDRVIAHKNFFFASAWSHYDTALPPTLRLLPASDRLDELRRDYAAMGAMIFGDAPEWSDIVRELGELEARINSLRTPRS